ncbi:invasion associated locus B family protein [Falsirhodobacter algicola]|uniref:Invasion associated locus B family protein n=1 Tax=Falsirhodobacter algicola TaxID=2692330 RepID=A0A8J8MSI5_9RHOB|nr:invasion associated locus B family protein [Falsirhodobacter algicola]QUS35418.1 invasion associated locus B family protein [Falsirhodobacter algicola]
MSRKLPSLLALMIGLGLAVPAFAQDAPAPAADDATAEQGLSMGQTEGQPAQDGPGSMYVEATFEDWQQRCIRAEEGQKDRCQLYKLLKDDQNNAVAEFSLFNLPQGNQAAAGATVIVPLETLLTANLSLKVDSSPAKVYPFTWCSEVGCVARIGFTQAEVDALKRGSKAVLTIVPVVAPDQKVNLDVSLAGFTAGYDAVVTSNAE